MAKFAPFGLVEVSDAGVIVDANEIFSRWFRPIHPAVVGEPLSQVFGISESDLSDALRRTDGGTGLIPATAIIGLGGPVPRRLVLASTRLENGNTSVGVVDASRQQDDQDDAERAQRLSQRESERLQLLLTASVSFANAMSAPELAELLAAAARETFRADWSSVHLVDGDEFSFAGGHNPLGEKWPVSAPPTGARTMQLGKVLVITDPAQAEFYLPGVGIAAVMEASGVHSILVAPITDHGVAIGTVACYFARRRTFDGQAEPLIRALSQQAGQVFSRLQLEEKLRRSAMLDATTGLPNRRLFEQQFESVSRTSSVMFLDLDGFKKVNDELGHATGDLLLGRVAHRLRDVFRHTDAVARYGGDEFVASIDASTRSGAMVVAERARAAIAETFPELPAHHRITASIGVALGGSRADPVPAVDQLIRVADRAMYVAKAKGGNRAEYRFLR